MGWIGAYNLIRIVAAVHVFLGYILIMAPQKLANDSSVMIVGEALGLQQPKSSFHENPLACALAGLVFMLSGISDFVAVSMSEEVARDYWGAQAPMRALFFTAISMYTYLLKPGRGNVSPTSNHPLVNSVIFSWAFMEFIWWFWVYISLREERSEAMARIMFRKQQKAEMDLNED
ncbi:increased loss of mitochondrial DNA protein 1 [Trichophaea hybrida]|nr:increased loss of mitochondrial DNA protein 1 [Trichophaea hybrida]